MTANLPVVGFSRRWTEPLRSFSYAVLVFCIVNVVLVSADAGVLVDQPYSVAYGDRLATKIFIDGKGPFTFLLDTASSRTVLYDHAREEVGLIPIPNETVVVYGLNGVLHTPAVRLQELRISDEQISGLTVAVLPDRGTRDDEADGILGLDVLERYAIVLDQKQHRLQLYAHSDSLPMPYSAWPNVPLLPRRASAFPFDLWYVKARLSKYNAGTVETTTLFDLGAGISIINWEIAHRFKLRKWGLSAPTVEEVQDGLGKRSPVARLSGLWVDIGDRSWPNQTVVIADPPVFDLLELNHKPAAIIGPGLLKNNSIAIDFHNRRLYLRMEQNPE